MRALFIAGLVLFISAVNAEEATGRVRAMYFEAAPGVMVDAKFSRTASQKRWADVQVGTHVTTLVQVPRDMKVAVGDVVAVALEAPRPVGLAAVTTIEPLPGIAGVSAAAPCAIAGTCSSLEPMRKVSRITGLARDADLASREAASASAGR
jgi:hypothetical protein